MAEGNRSTPVSPEALRNAIDILAQCSGEIYALDDIGRRLERSPFSHYTIDYAISAIASSLRGKLVAADALLDKAVHPMHHQTATATDALNALEEFMSVVCGETWQVRPTTAGLVILEFAIRLGKAVDAAEIACGSSIGSMGYLDGSALDPMRPEQLKDGETPAAHPSRKRCRCEEQVPA